MTARRAAVEALLQVDRDGGYSNIVLDRMLRTQALARGERTLASRIFYGVIERRLTLDYFLARCSSLPVKKMHPAVAEILRAGAYQLLFMDRVPPSAAVNESVNLARAMGQDRAAGFVNGVLRGLERRKADIWASIPAGEDGWPVRYSCPPALIRLWKRAYGAEKTATLLEHINDVPDIAVRVNTLKTTPEELAGELAAQGVHPENMPDLPACFRFSSADALKTLAKERENCYYHQDAASQYCCAAFDPQPGERIADVCAAPGGKSFTAALMMENRGRILSCDIYPAKCEEMERRAQALGIGIIDTAVRDAAAPCPEPLAGCFDRVLCDVPCSGLGAIRRKPEIRYKDPASYAELPALQYAIMEQAARMVRIGGVLQYATCTLNPAENEEVAGRFLAEHPEFAPRQLPLDALFAAQGIPPAASITLFPPEHRTDGFFIAGFTRRG